MTEPTSRPTDEPPDDICDDCLEPEPFLRKVTLTERNGPEILPVEVWLCQDCINHHLGD